MESLRIRLRRIASLDSKLDAAMRASTCSCARAAARVDCRLLDELAGAELQAERPALRRRWVTARRYRGLQAVYCASTAVRAARDRLNTAAATSVIGAGSPFDLVTVMTDLAARGIRWLMVEGGQIIHTQFLAAGLADELQLVIAPFFVGDAGAPRFVGPAAFPPGLRPPNDTCRIAPDRRRCATSLPAQSSRHRRATPGPSCSALTGRASA
ncbi:MAG: dihydrofolate reductase family protein [Streptosporangiaceae bacterium]